MIYDALLLLNITVHITKCFICVIIHMKKLLQVFSEVDVDVQPELTVSTDFRSHQFVSHVTRYRMIY